MERYDLRNGKSYAIIRELGEDCKVYQLDRATRSTTGSALIIGTYSDCRKYIDSQRNKRKARA